MAANTAPIYGRTPDVQVGGAILGPTAVTATDGTGSLVSIFQADPTEGGYVDHIVIKPVGSTVATVVRIFICTVTGAFTSGTSNTVANTALIRENALAAIGASNVSSNIEVIVPIRRALPPGFRILVGVGTSTGSAGNGFAFTTFASKY